MTLSTAPNEGASLQNAGVNTAKWDTKEEYIILYTNSSRGGAAGRVAQRKSTRVASTKPPGRLSAPESVFKNIHNL